MNKVNYTLKTYTVFAINRETYARLTYQVDARSPDDAEYLVHDFLDSEDVLVAGVVLGTVELVG